MPVSEYSQIELARLLELRRKRSNQLLVVVAVLSVVVPFLFWRGTWFGRPLSEAELGQYLADNEKPRHSQHALVQIGQRIEHGDASVGRWYPQVIALAQSPHPEIRVTLAWVMGADNRSQDFHRALTDLLRDPEPLVRRNAALSLVRFGDAGGRPELLNMLRPYTVRVPRDGVLRYRVKPGNSVESGTVLAQLESGEDKPFEIRSPVEGRVERKLAEEGTKITSGSEILVLSPGSEHVWEALRALYLVGDAEDLPDVGRYAVGNLPEMSARIQQQAALTAAKIRERSGENDPATPGSSKEKAPEDIKGISAGGAQGQRGDQ